MWYDEIGTAWMASLPFPRLLAATAGDVHPPLYLALAWLVAHTAGASALALRLPSSLLSIVGIIALLPLAKQLKLSGPATLAATAIMALSSWQLHYGQEARMYALLQLLVMWACGAMLARRWGQVALAVAAMLYTHNYGVLYAAALGGLAVGRELAVERRAGAVAAPTLSFGLAGLAYAPWTWVAAQQAAAAQSSWWSQPTTLGAALQPFYAFLYRDVGWAFGSLMQVTTFALLAMAGWRLLQRRPPAAIPLVALALGPLALALLAEIVYRPILLDRALIGSAPAVYLVLGWLLGDGLAPAWRRAGWAVLGPLLALGAVFYAPSNVILKAQNTPALAGVIEAQPGDLVYHVNMASAFYLRGAGLERQAVAPPFPLDRGALSPQTIAALGMPVGELERLSWHRAWLIWVAGPNQSAQEDAWVAAVLARHQHEQVYALRVGLAGELMGGGVWLLER